LHIAGPALFTRYFKDEPLTASVLLRHTNGGELLYDTRDRVSVLPDGKLRYVGRVDDTVKVRGFRVDVTEVERTMLLHPELRHAAVVAKADGTGTSTLHGFYSPASVEPTSVYDILRRRLPEYMVPSALRSFDSFPLMPSGKTDRQRLLLESKIAPAKPAPERPGSPTEARVIDVVRSVLGEDEIDPTRSFFEIGGTSLAAFALMHRLREAFGLGHESLSDQAIYQFSSVEALASHIDALVSGTAVAPTSNAVLVTLRTASDPALPPFFLISSAGGTLGAYQKLTKALETKRELIGVRDPFVWGARDATQGFSAWVEVYLDAIRERQPHGPYDIGAYSSASVFGYEIARRLRELGEEVRLLALIDPLALDFASRRRFGHWAFHARVWRPRVKPLVLLGGLARRAALAALPERATPAVDSDVSKPGGFEQIANDARNDQEHILGFSVLLELNTGLPFALRRSELARLDSSRYVNALIEKVRSVSPEVDAASIRNMIVQYRLQTRAQFRYRLKKYDGRLVLVEPEGPHQGLFESQFRPFVRQLRSVSAPLAPSERQVRLLDEAFQRTLHAHYLSMRDDQFVQATARVLDEELAKSEHRAASDG
jgi:acyl carrier protein